MTDSRPVIDQNAIDKAAGMRLEMRAETEGDTLERARWRMNVTFLSLYDDEPSEPDQALRDLFTDLCHEANARGIDIDYVVSRGHAMYLDETADWRERDGE